MPDNFSIQRIPASEHAPENLRITHTATDSRVATCYDYANAVFIRDALNSYSGDYMKYLRNLADAQGSFVAQHIVATDIPSEYPCVAFTPHLTAVALAELAEAVLKLDRGNIHNKNALRAIATTDIELLKKETAL